jgi:hypothetical protein
MRVKKNGRKMFEAVPPDRVAKTQHEERIPAVQRVSAGNRMRAGDTGANYT